MNHVQHGDEEMETEEETLDPMETRTGETPEDDRDDEEEETHTRRSDEIE